LSSYFWELKWVTIEFSNSDYFSLGFLIFCWPTRSNLDMANSNWVFKTISFYRISQIVSIVLVVGGIVGYVIYETHTNFARLQSCNSINQCPIETYFHNNFYFYSSWYCSRSFIWLIILKTSEKNSVETSGFWNLVPISIRNFLYQMGCWTSNIHLFRG
jgi:hypothetical protein